MLPAWIIQAIDSLAKKRGCSANDLLAGQSQRMISDLDFLDKVELKVDEIVRLRHAGKADADAWPKRSARGPGGRASDDALLRGRD
jgi:hypothetical protein